MIKNRVNFIKEPHFTQANIHLTHQELDDLIICLDRLKIEETNVSTCNFNWREEQLTISFILQSKKTMRKKNWLKMSYYLLFFLSLIGFLFVIYQVGDFVISLLR